MITIEPNKCQNQLHSLNSSKMNSYRRSKQPKHYLPLLKKPKLQIMHYEHKSVNLDSFRQKDRAAEGRKNSLIMQKSLEMIMGSLGKKKIGGSIFDLGQKNEKNFQAKRGGDTIEILELKKNLLIHRRKHSQKNDGCKSRKTSKSKPNIDKYFHEIELKTREGKENKLSCVQSEVPLVDKTLFQREMRIKYSFLNKKIKNELFFESQRPQSNLEKPKQKQKDKSLEKLKSKCVKRTNKRSIKKKSTFKMQEKEKLEPWSNQNIESVEFL